MPIDAGATDTDSEASPPSRLQSTLAARILRWLKDEGAERGKHLIETELCAHFNVSRTPIRGALKQLASQGLVESRARRGFVLLDAAADLPDVGQVSSQSEEDQKLIMRIAQARNTEGLPDEVTQQEICRIFAAKLSTALRVLGQLADLGVVERKPGNGWAFTPLIDTPRAQQEVTAFRRAVEPQLMLQPTFELDRDWLRAIKARHIAFRKRAWRRSLAVEFYDMNSAFHEGLARCSGNRYLLDAVQKQIQLRTFVNYHWEFGVDRVRESIDEHLRIIAALERGDVALASAEMHDHLSQSARMRNSLRDDLPLM